MRTNRLEAFSDGVIAIIVTIMVLELKVPHDTTLRALLSMWPTFLSYLLSFLVVAIMWVNHHHLISMAKRADASVLWTNNGLLFCMSLIPFATAYMGENHAEGLPVAAYGAVCVGCSFAFWALRAAIVAQATNIQDAGMLRGRSTRKNVIGLVMYSAAIPLAFVSATASLCLYFLVAASYFLPERALEQASGTEK